MKRKKYSEEYKKHLSEKMKIAHKEGRHPGWSFINNDINKRSYPEKWFIKNVLEKYDLYSKYTIKEKYSYSKYFLDFALLEIKLDIEIDGQQHFKTKESIEHDKIRDKYLNDNGWYVYRLSWAELKNDPNSCILLFLNSLASFSLNRKYNIEEVSQYIKKYHPKYGTREDYSKKVKEQTDIKNKQKIEKILKADIDFSKFGWIGEISKLIDIPYQKVNKFMIRYLPEIYYNKCFKRKRAHITPRYERGEV